MLKASYPTSFVRSLCLILRGRNSFISPTVNGLRVPGSNRWSRATYHGARHPGWSCRPRVALRRDDKHFNSVRVSPILPLSPALGGSRLFAPAHGATPFAALSHGCWHRAWPLSLLATVTNILCLVLISPSRREETGPALQARPVQSLDLVGLPWPLLCLRTALGPLLSVHLAVPGAAPDVPGMTGTRGGGEALPPGPRRAGSASNKRESSKHARELRGGSQPFPTGRDTRASSAPPSPPPPGRLAKGDGPCQPLSGGERHPGSAQGVSASRGSRKVSTASTALTYSHNEDTP